MSRIAIPLALLAATAGAYLVANSLIGSRYVYEKIPASRRPAHVSVDTDFVSGVANPIAVTQELMNAWNAIPQAQQIFGIASAGGPYNGSNAGQSFGVFTNRSHEVAFDADGQIMTFFGVGPGVLGITLKAVDASSGQIFDFLCVVNTQPGALSGNATPEELFRTTLLHELGHAFGLGHSPVGMVNGTVFGLAAVQPSQIPTMYPFRTPTQPEQGGTLEHDDRAGAICIYPADNSGLGSISGKVESLGGAPVNAMFVRAIGPVGGPEAHVGAFSNFDAAGDGNFSIKNLPAGDYRVLIEAVNGRKSVSGDTVATGTNSLGSDPFLFAGDEFWRLADSYQDDPAAFTLVRVRAGRDTGSVNFVLNGQPIFQNETLSGDLNSGDARVPSGIAGFHFADYFVFQGSAGQNVSVTATGSFTPQLRLLRPSDMGEEASDLPFLGNTAQINRVLGQSGVYTVLVFSGSSGAYNLTLTGAGSGLAPPPAPIDPSLEVGPADPGGQAFASPVCSLGVLQLEVFAPSHDELWIDRIVVNSSGSGDEVMDISRVRLVRDTNADGKAQAGEPELAASVFGSDDGAVSFNSVGLQCDAGTVEHLLVVFEVDVKSVVGGSLLWMLPLLPILLCLRPRKSTLVLLLMVLPLSCGGGGVAACQNSPFDPGGAAVTFTPRIDPGGVLAFRSTGGDAPVPLVTVTLSGGTLTVSN